MTRRRKSTPVKSADIFARTKRAPSGTRRPGRPPVHEEAWTKVTVVLFNRQIVFDEPMAFLDCDALSLLQFEFPAIGRAVIKHPVRRVKVGDFDTVLFQQPGKPIKVNPVADETDIRFRRVKGLIM